MTDNNEHNDPIERFFREKSQEYDIQYREEDWQKLENRLDKVDKQHVQRRRRRMVAAAVILLFAVLAYFTYEQQMTINELNEQISQQERVTNPPKEDSGIQNDNRGTGSDAESRSDTEQTDTKDPNTGNNNKLAAESAIHSGENGAQNADKTAKQHGLLQPFTKTNFKGNHSDFTIAEASPGFDGRSPAISAIKPIKTDRSTGTAPANAETSTLSSSSSPEMLGQRTIPRFSVGILGGPDLSTVGGLSNFYNPGYKIGVSLEYNITKNLAVTAGAIRSTVQYTASGSEYQPPEGYWSYGVVPDKTVGKCVLIDIPISLKYDFMQFKQSRLYASAGLSSYIMLNEDYRFNYENNYQSGLKQRWQERTGTRHWMSNATVSIGYELDVMHNISLRAEPFLKLPIQKVGWANVDLYSVGSYISLNYNFH